MDGKTLSQRRLMLRMLFLSTMQLFSAPSLARHKICSLLLSGHRNSVLLLR